MDIAFLTKYIPLLLQGAYLTIKIAFFSAVLSFVLGMLFGICTAKRMRLPLLSPLVEAITFVLRAVPFYVQLIIVYFVLPDIVGINLDEQVASIVSLAFCSSGYVAQIVRQAINGICIEQWYAAKTLGYSTIKTLRYIILPQVSYKSLPVLTNELDSLLKSTAILSSIGLLELTRVGMNIVSREMEPLTIYLAVALIYLILSGAINLVSKYLENGVRYA